MFTKEYYHITICFSSNFYKFTKNITLSLFNYKTICVTILKFNLLKFPWLFYNLGIIAEHKCLHLYFAVIPLASKDRAFVLTKVLALDN